MSQRTVGIDPQALNALRREYDALPRDKHGKCVRGSTYEELLKATLAAKKALLDAVKKRSGSKKDMGDELARALTPDGDLDKALLRIEREVREQADAPFAAVEYDTIFNDKVQTALGLPGLKAAIEDYVLRYNELLSKSTYFKKGTFDYYNAGQIAKSLSDNGFFSAKHAVHLKAKSGNREITTQAELEAVITEDKDVILTDKALRTRFDTIAKQLEKNVELRKFCLYLQNNEPLLARMSKPEVLKEDILKSYLKADESLYQDWIAKFDAATGRRKDLEEQARATTSVITFPGATNWLPDGCHVTARRWALQPPQAHPVVSFRLSTDLGTGSHTSPKPITVAVLFALAKQAGEKPIGVEFSHYFGLRALVE